ncbi:MAG: cytochrome-c peroxidase [Geobacteraceae bacterium]
MKRATIALSMLICFTAVSAWAQNDTMKRAQAVFSPIPLKPKTITGNAANPGKLDLGKKLFFDPRLSASFLISCNTCHNVGLAGADLQETSIGHGWQKGPRNAPTVFNSVFNIAQFWDGRAEDLKAQAKGPVQALVEMHNTPERVVVTLKSMPEYRALFARAFPGEKDPVTFDNMAKAIEIFEVTLTTPDSPFDRYLKGNRKALSAREEKGLAIFLDKGCVACHQGINVGGSGYFPFGVIEAPAADIRPAADTGRFKVTHTAQDNYVFRSPSLRNVALTPPYFHSGRVWKLKDAVTIMGSAQLGIKLNNDDASSLVTFLATLTGRQPTVVYPILPPNSDSTPLPITK